MDTEHLKSLLPLVDRLSGVPVLVVGDLVLDHYIYGVVDRISPEAPVVVVQVREEDRRLGGATNVVGNIVSLGGRAAVCGVVGDDDAGSEICRQLENLGVDTDGVFVDPSRPTTVKTRVVAHGQQVVRVDREVTTEVNTDLGAKIAAAAKAKLAGMKAVIVSDYAKGVVSEPLFAGLRGESNSGRIGGQSVPILIDPKAPNFHLYAGATIIKPNRGEAERASGVLIRTRDDAAKAGALLLDKWKCEMVLITMGEDGLVLVSKNFPEAMEVETRAREVFDVSGAGDTVSAAFALSLGAGIGIREAAELANFAAGVVVGEVGTAVVTPSELKLAIQREVS